MRILGKEERWEPALECVSGRVETPRRARGQRRRRSLERPGARAGSGRLPPGLLFQAGGGRALAKRQPRSLQLYKETERLKSPDKLFIFLRCGFS